MMETKKAERTRLADELARSVTADADKIRKLMRICFEEAHEALLSTHGETLLTKQAEAKAYRRVLDAVTTPSPLNKE